MKEPPVETFVLNNIKKISTSLRSFRSDRSLQRSAFLYIFVVTEGI